MKNPLLKAIKKTKAVLCVVTCVSKTAEKTELSHRDNTDGKLEREREVNLFFITTNTLP